MICYNCGLSTEGCYLKLYGSFVQICVQNIAAYAALRIKTAEVACDNEMHINQNLCLFVFIQLSLAAKKQFQHHHGHDSEARFGQDC